MAKVRLSRLAMGGGAPAVTEPAPRWPVAGDLEVAWMEGVVRGGQWSWWGPHEKAFCSEFASFLGTRRCLLMANGTVTLQCALQAVGVAAGDEVIVPGLTWVATAQAALDVGANVVLVDVDPETMCLDPRAVRRALTPRTKAIVPVHLYGCMADMDAIQELARRHNLKIVEDVAHQHGSRWRNRCAGALGEVGSFSFQQSKILTCGEGGAVSCNDEQVYETLHCLKQVGWMSDLKTPGNRYGHNYRATEMQAVLLRGGLQRLEEQNRLREENAQRVREGLRRIGGPLRAARRDERVTLQAYYGMTLVFDPRKARGCTREDYLAALAAEHCRLARPYAPVYRSPLLNLYDSTSPVPARDRRKIQNYRDLKLPGVERACEVTGVILMHQYLLGSERYIRELLAAVEKVSARLPEVKRLRDRKRKDRAKPK